MVQFSSADTTCTICSDALEGTEWTRLECGHSFHVACVLQWFRYEHTTCPNCRSDQTQHVWTRRTPLQHVSDLRKRKKSLPKYVQKKLLTCDTARRVHKDNKRELNKLHKEYKEIFKKQRKLENKVYASARKYRDIVHELTHVSSPGAPMLVYQGYESISDDEEDDG